MSDDPKSDAVRVWSVWMTWVRTMSVNELKELLKRTYQGDKIHVDWKRRKVFVNGEVKFSFKYVW